MPLGTFPADSGMTHQVLYTCGPDNSLTIQHGFFSLGHTGPSRDARGHIWFTTTDDWNNGKGGRVISEEDWSVEVNARKVWACPDNTDSIVVRIDEAEAPVSWHLELVAK